MKNVIPGFLPQNVLPWSLRIHYKESQVLEDAIEVSDAAVGQIAPNLFHLGNKIL